MLGSLSNNTIWAKVMAKFGHRLTAQNYNDLLACQSVGEAALYLKNNTYYDSILDEVKNTDVHRGRLEELLHRRQFEDFSSLCAFEFAGSSFFYKIIIRRNEIEQLLHCLRLLSFGKEDEYLFRLPTFFANHTEINLIGLAKCKTFDEILSVLVDTEYAAMLKKFKPQEGQPLDFTGIETTLNTYLYDTIFSLIKKNTHGSARKELSELYNMEAELENVLRIVRLKKGFRLSPQFIRSCLISHWLYITPKLLEDMLEAESADEVLRIFQKSKYGKKMPQDKDYLYYEQRFQQILFQKAIHMLHFSVNPSSIFAAYSVFSRIELHNIINIIEGIRYQLSQDQIREMLILENS